MTDNLLIYNYNYWDLYLNNNQYYLGRCILWAKRLDALDFVDTTSEERAEFFGICSKLKSALNNLFSPELYNYASLGNAVRHLHVHIIPRYDNEVLFHGIKFIDENRGKNYEPHSRDFTISDTIRNEIMQAIRGQLEVIGSEPLTDDQN